MPVQARFPPLVKGGKGGLSDARACATGGEIPLNPPLIKGEATLAGAFTHITR